MLISMDLSQFNKLNIAFAHTIYKHFPLLTINKDKALPPHSMKALGGKEGVAPTHS
jgi:hypothetical protein